MKEEVQDVEEFKIQRELKKKQADGHLVTSRLPCRHERTNKTSNLSSRSPLSTHEMKEERRAGEGERKARETVLEEEVDEKDDDTSLMLDYDGAIDLLSKTRGSLSTQQCKKITVLLERNRRRNAPSLSLLPIVLLCLISVISGSCIAFNVTSRRYKNH